MKRWIVALLVVAAIRGLGLAPLPIDDTTRIHNSVSIPPRAQREVRIA